MTLSKKERERVREESGRHKVAGASGSVSRTLSRVTVRKQVLTS